MNNGYQIPQQPVNQQKKNNKNTIETILIVLLIIVIAVIIVINTIQGTKNEMEEVIDSKTTEVEITSKETTTKKSTTTKSTSTTTTISAEDYKSSCTKIAYKDLARNPDNYKGQKIKMYGQVLQVLEDGNTAELRVATKKSDYSDLYYEDVIYVYVKNYNSNNRILEDDYITLYGPYNGTMSYESVLGETITIPSMTAKYFEIK